MSSEATGLRLSSPSPELAASKIFSRKCLFRPVIRTVLAIASLTASLLCHAHNGVQSSTSKQVDTIHGLRLIASTMEWSLHGNSLLLALVVATILGCFAIWMFRRSFRNAKPTKISLPLLRVQSLSHWATRNDETRKEFSRELHDSVGPLLTAVGLQLSALQSSPNIPSALKEQLQEVNGLNSEALRQIRDLAMGIRPALLTDVNVVAALEHQVRQFSRCTGIAAFVRADADLDQLPEEHRACIYRCVSEALTNCAKHSRAKNIRILVGLSKESVTVQVEDDGVGIERSRNRMGLGLIGMRERVSKVNGKLMVASHRRGGTSLTLEIPTPGGVLA